MKKLLSIVLCNNAGEALNVEDERAELLRLEENSDGQNPKALYELIKQTKGKYVIIIDTDCTVAEEDFAQFLNIAEECTADILAFDGGYALKSSTLKSVAA